MSSQQKRIKRSITTYQKTSSGGSKKIFDPQLQSFTKRIRRFDTSHHHNGSKHQKLTIQIFCEKVLIALDYFYVEDQSGFYTDCREFLEKGMSSWKQKIVDRMNTYQYVQMAIAHKPFTDIEFQIIKEWKKNYLLFAIMTFWYNSVQKSHFLSLKQFKKKYDIFRDFVANISGEIFKSWLNNWQKRMNVKAFNKLLDETSHFVITESSQFKRIYEKILTPLIDRQFIGTTLNWQYNLSQLQTKKCVLDLSRQQNLPKTIQVLKKFIKQTKLSKKLQLLREYRLVLQQEVNLRQQQIRLQQGHSRTEVLQGDDFISALVYCTIKGRLQQLRYSLLYMVTILGEQLAILSKLKTKVYFDHLWAVNQFLTIHRVTQQQQKQMQKLGNLAINRRMKIQSSPLIEDKQFEEVLLDEKRLVTVRNFTQVEEGSKDKGVGC